MTPNLIERLREHRNDGGCDCRGCSRCEAANDLERLLAEVAELRADRERLESVALSADRLVARTIELRARIEAAIDYFESDAWERVEPGELRRILHGE